MTTCDRLFVIWGDPEDGTRYVIGDLWRDDSSQYRFAYRESTPLSRGFTLLTEFPEHRNIEHPYKSPRLFPTFAQRIPSKTRPDFLELLRSWGVENEDDPLEILARSGGVQITDKIELAEYRDPKDDLSKPLSFRVAGMKHHHGGAAERLQIGADVVLQREPDNKYDPHATLVVVHDGNTLGRVPRQYTPIFARLLDDGRKIRAVAERRLTLPTEIGRWVIRAQAK